MDSGVPKASSELSSQLTREDVVYLARIQRLPIRDSDVDEICYRFNALVEALGRLGPEELTGIDPLPLMSHTEEP